MAALNANSNSPRFFPGLEQQLASTWHVPKVHHVIWREWRNCEDEEYAQYLFELVVNEAFDRQVIIVLGFIGAIFGAIGGGLLPLLFSSEDSGIGAPKLCISILVGLVMGSGIGLVTGRRLKLRRRSQWGEWLQGLIPSKPVVHWQTALNFHALYFILAFGLSSGLGVGVTGTLFLGQANTQLYGLSIALLVTYIYILSPLWEEKARLIDLFVGIIAGTVFGMLFGLGFAQVVGNLFGTLDVLNSARAVGLAVGLGFGLCFGRRAGLVGLLMVQVVLAGLILVMGFNLVLLGWLLGLLLGGVVGAYSRWWRPPWPGLSFTNAYAYRWVYLWWARRPPVTQVEAALRSLADEESPLKPLSQRRKRPKTVQQLMEDLRSASWRERLIARHKLVALGGEVVPLLIALISTASKADKLHKTARWLIRSIGYDTTTRLAKEPDLWICPDCLTCCGSHFARHRGFPVKYYGCRICRQSRDLFYCSQGVVAVLDADWNKAYEYRDNRLRINALTRETLSDFHEVEILHATDEDVERFAVRVGNDMDPTRKPRYSRMRCTITPECRLSENALKVLQRTFGQVEQGAAE